MTALMAILGGCGTGSGSGGSSSPSSAVRTGPLTPDDADRISAEQAAAIAVLAAVASAQAPDPNAAHHGHSEAEVATTLVLDAAEQATFDRQWAVARAAVPQLDTPAEAVAAGYTRAAVQGAGVGVHWVNWTLIDAPFDSARPSMLLFDERAGREDLVGFSYWLRADQVPDGFAGTNDVWHQHTSLCVVNGWIDREMAESPTACAGHYLAGSDLWMLHAWIVPARPNRWGDFAVLNPALCPSSSSTPDIARCPTSPGS